MKYSIRIKITILFIGIMTLTIGACYLMNSVFLRPYYIRYKEKNMQMVYERLNRVWSDEMYYAHTDQEIMEVWGNNKKELMKMMEDYGADFVIADNSWTIYSTNADDRFINKLQDYMYLSEFDAERLAENMVFDPHVNAEYLEMWGYLDCGFPFLITIPMESIRESTEISNRFLMYTGLLGILLGSIIISLTSRKITKPISTLSKISEQMNHLDFDAKYKGKEKDEIGVLGNNINELSETLEKTIKDLKNANLELTRDIEQKEKIDEMRVEFISNVSHELKTPIALIAGYAEGLKEGVTDDPESMSYYCDVISDEAEKMNNIVKKLLTLTQMEFGAGILELTRFDLYELLDGVVQNFEVLAAQNGLTIEVDRPFPDRDNEAGQENKVYVYGDEFQIEEVLRNYISNAIHYCTGKKIVRIYTQSTESLIRICVYNSGTQIPEGEQEKIWDKFYKVDKARTREYGGSGIGLSIVKAIMDSHEKRYGVKNVDDGVIFWFELEKG